MKHAVPLTAAALVALGAFCLCGCKGEPAVTADTAPFEAAIQTYLAAKSMGMKVTEFESLEVRQGAAMALCRMEEASGLYGGVAVRWRFTFTRDRQGDWQVETHAKR
ncbi:MAG: hypothetical protein ACYS8L_05710 [Planctomycetota bacterium]|jgi:hypothetical protein